MSSIHRGHAVVAALLLSCGASLSTLPPGIPELAAEQDGTDFDRVLVSWRPATGDLAGYEVQSSADGVTFAAVEGGVVNAEVLRVAVAVDPLVPEQVSLWFRARALGRAGPGAWSPGLEYHRTLRPPDTFSAWVQGGTVTLLWVGHSSSQTGWLLERQVVDPAGAVVEAWTALAVPFPADRRLDPLPPSAQDGARVSYRLRARAGEVLSSPATAELGPGELLAPVEQAFVSLAGGVRVSWTNRSRFATEVAIFRSPLPFGEEVRVALLPASATGYTDLALAEGWYQYRIVARRPGATPFPLTSFAPPLLASTQLPFSLTLVPSLLTLPSPVQKLVRGDGWYGSEGLHRSAPAAVDFPRDGGLERLLLPEGSGLESPGVLLDPTGRPHLVYGEGPQSYTAPVPIVHAWLQGGTWQREVIASRVLSSGDLTQVVRAAMSPTGALQVVWVAGPDAAQGLEYARQEGASWVVESLTAALPQDRRLRYTQFLLATSSDEQPYVLLDDFGTLTLAMRSEAGWAVEAVPLDRVNDSWVDQTLAFQRTAGTAFIAYTTGAEGEVHAATRTGPPVADAGVWTVSPTLGKAGTDLTLRAAVGPGGRFAVVQGYRSATQLWVGDGTGWTAWRGPPPAQAGTPDVGFGPGGKLWVVDGLGNFCCGASTLNHVLFQEP